MPPGQLGNAWCQLGAQCEAWEGRTSGLVDIITDWKNERNLGTTQDCLSECENRGGKMRNRFSQGHITDSIAGETRT